MAATRATDIDAPCCTKRKAPAVAAWTPRVATWVKVVLDKRIKKNLALQDVPAVVSRVDPESESVNVLYPNKLSMFLYKTDQMPKMLFAIETYPVNKVQPWEGSTTQLDQVLIHAMLHFAEQRGRALSGTNLIQAVPQPLSECVTIDAAGQAVDGHVVKRNQIKLGLKNLAEDVGNKIEAPSPSSSPALETPRREEQALSPKQMQNKFTVRLSQLFQTKNTDKMFKGDIHEALGAEFPLWGNLLAALDAINVILIAEDVVFRV